MKVNFEHISVCCETTQGMFSFSLIYNISTILGSEG